MEDIDKMTLREYQLRMEAWQLREIALQDHLWQLAFYTRDAKSNNGKKYRFKGPSDVFQTEKAIDKVRSTYEPWYTSPRLEKIKTAKVLQKMQREWEEMQKQKKGVSDNGGIRTDGGSQGL